MVDPCWRKKDHSVFSDTRYEIHWIFAMVEEMDVIREEHVPVSKRRAHPLVHLVLRLQHRVGDEAASLGVPVYFEIYIHFLDSETRTPAVVG